MQIPRHRLIGGILVAVVTALVFARVLEAGFLRWDDNVELYQNPHLRPLDLSAIKWMFTDTSYVWRYQPLTWLGWFLTCSLFGFNPVGYHLGNWLMHVGTSVLFFAVLCRLIARVFPQVSSTRATQAAVVGALLWAIHPLRVEPVAWATGRLYCQAGLFFTLALFCYLNVSPAEVFRRSRWYWAALAAFACSLLSYPAGLALPFVILFLDWALNPQKKWSTILRSLIRVAPFVMVTGFVSSLGLVARFFAGGDWPQPASLSEFSILQRLAQASYIATYYLWRPFWPFDLAPIYTTLLEVRPFDLRFLASGLAALVLTGFLLSRWKKYPVLLAAWFCHLFILLPHFGLTEKPHFPTDRYSYLEGMILPALAALCLLRAVKLEKLLLVFAGLVLAFGALSFHQTRIWKSNQTFFSYILGELGSNPYRYDIHYRLGIVAEEAKDFPTAEQEYGRSLEIGGDFADGHWRLANVYFLQKKHVNAIREYSLALNGKPRNPELHNNMGDALFEAGELDKATDHYETAVQLKPNFTQARSNLGIAFAQKGRLKEAEGQFRAVLQATPADPAAHVNLAINLRSQGRTNEANAEFSAARALPEKK